MRLTGKVVLITNVSQYMGPACAEEFAKEGAILALHERTEPRAHAALELARAHGREATVVTGDLTTSGEANRGLPSPGSYGVGRPGPLPFEPHGAYSPNEEP